MKNEYKCGDCGKKTGELHIYNCDIERCPKCKGQLLSCDCNFISITQDNYYLIDKGGKKWKRHLVKNSVDEDFGD